MHIKFSEKPNNFLPQISTCPLFEKFVYVLMDDSWNRSFESFSKIHSKGRTIGLFFLVKLQSFTTVRRTLWLTISCESCEMFQNSFLDNYVRVTAFGVSSSYSKVTWKFPSIKFLMIFRLHVILLSKNLLVHCAEKERNSGFAQIYNKNS